MKLAIVGSRSIKDKTIVINALKDNYDISTIDCIVSGGAKGVDSFAAEIAKDNSIKLVEFLPEYDKYGRGAPLMRNTQIIEYCDEVLAVTEGESRGTMDSVNKARNLNKKVKLIKI